MNVTFDITDKKQRDAVLRAIAAFQPVTEAPQPGGVIPIVDPAEQVQSMDLSPGATPAATVDAPAGVGVELDANGCPWLEAVHAGTKTKNADGTWRRKRGGDAKIAEAAEKEAIEEINRARAFGSVEAPIDNVVQLGEATEPPAPAGLVLGAPTEPVVEISWDEINRAYASMAQSRKIDNDAFQKANTGFFATHGIDPLTLMDRPDERRRLYDLLMDPNTDYTPWLAS